MQCLVRTQQKAERVNDVEIIIAGKGKQKSPIPICVGAEKRTNPMHHCLRTTVPYSTKSLLSYHETYAGLIS
jgi:hypothetical protein